MRIGIAFIGAFLAVGVTQAPASPQTPCPGDLVNVHSTVETRGTALGGVRTTDGSVLVTVARPPAPGAHHWGARKSLVGATHAFISAGKPLDEERVDVSPLYSPLAVDIFDDRNTLLCTIADALVAIPTLKDGLTGTSTVYVLPQGMGWTPKSADTMQFTPDILMQQPFVSYDGTAVHITGRLAWGGVVRSRSIIDLQLTAKSGQLASKLPIAFDIMPSDASSTEPYTVVLDTFACNSNGTWRCDFGASLALPKGITANGGQPIGLTLQNGVFKLREAKTVPITWNTAPANSRIDLSSLEIDPLKHTFVGTGQILINGSQFSLTSFGLARARTGDYFPTGTIELQSDQMVKLPNFTLTGFSGKMDFGANDQPTTVSANATLNLTLGTGTTLAALVKGVKITAPSSAFTDLKSFSNPGTSWKPDFSQATIVPIVDKSKIFNHLLEPCNPKAMPTVESEGESAMRLCLGLHLGTGTVRNDDDIAYGYATFQSWNPTQPALALRSLSFTLPPKQPATLRFGAGKMGISALRIDVYKDGAPSGTAADSAATSYAGFDADIGTRRLTALHCDRLGIVGEATISEVVIGNATQTISATPRLGFGQTCTAFAVRGFLPIQLSPQSNIMLSSLAFVHSRVDTEQLDYLNASGSVTSGSVTVVFNAIGFRTFLKNDNPINCVRELREYEMFNTRVCAIVDVNMPMTLAATGAQNSSAIKDAISKAASAVFGFFAGRRI